MIFITDTHLKNSNTEENKSIWAQAIDYAKKYGCDIVHAGDICDSRVGWDTELQEVFQNILLEAEENGVVVHCIAGNHDKKDLNGTFSYLSPYKFHKAFNLYEDVGFLDIGAVRYHFLAYFKEKETYPAKLSKAVDNIDKGMKNVLVTHCSISGVKNNDGTEVDDKHGININFFKAFDTVIVGHYHNKQSFNNVHYIGSTFPHNFGENNEKGIIHFDGSTLEYLPTSFRKYLNFPVSIKEASDIAKLYDTVFDEIEMVKVVISGESSLIESVNKSKIKANKIVTVKEDFLKIEEDNLRIVHNKDSISESFIEYCKERGLNKEEGILCRKL